jgi:hypothetical protein
MHGQSAYPQLRVLALVETGTHALFGAAMGGCRTSEHALLPDLLPQLQPGMLCLCDRGFWGYDLWNQALATGAALLWRAPKDLRLSRDRTDLPDGSYLSQIYRGKDWKAKRQGVTVRVVDYQLEGVAAAEPFYRVITNLLDPVQAPAEELAALYPERWEEESVFDEVKTHLRGARVVLRSQTPDLVKQEVWGLLLAHYAVRGLMHEAALAGNQDPDRLSFVHAVRVVRRLLPQWAAFSPLQRVTLHAAVQRELLAERLPSRRRRDTPRGVKRQVRKYPSRPKRPNRKIEGKLTLRLLAVQLN